MPSAAIPPSSTADQRFLGSDAAFEAHPGGEHQPPALEKARGLLDVDAVRAGDLAVERSRAPAQQREPEVLLGDEVTEDQRRRGGARSRSLTVRVPGVKACRLWCQAVSGQR